MSAIKKGLSGLSRLRVAMRAPLDQRIFFLHLAKCGGSSLRRAIKRCYQSSLLPADPPCAHLDPHASLRAAKISGEPLGAYRERLLLYLLSSNSLRFVSGHFEFSETAHREFSGEWDFITLLRDPVARWFSNYFFNRYKQADHFSIDQELDAFVESELAVGLGHFTVSKLTASGDGPLDDPKRSIARAIEVLERFELVGCLEELPTFASDFERRYGQRLDIGRERANPLPKGLQEQQITPALRRRVEALCEPDLEVYEYALARVQRG